MQENFKKYQHYTVSDFALDEEFMDAVWHPTPEKNTFWDNIKNDLPEQSKNMDDAALIIRSFQSPKGAISEEVKARIWQSVQAGSQKAEVVRLEPHKRNYFWTAAAILLVMLGGYWLFWNTGKDGRKVGEEIVESGIRNDIAPGGDKAVLTLADGSQIVLDSANNGLIATEANTNIVKLKSGEIAYDARSAGKNEVQYNTIRTPRGGQYQLMLADGTKVWLNAESSLKYPTAFTGNDRKVQLTGEGYFEVAHDAEKPFYVSVDEMDVKVLGTHINVNAYTDEEAIRTTLLEGSVSVSEGGRSVTIRPGEQARVVPGSDAIRIQNNVDLDAIVAWKNGLFYFDGANVRTVMKTLSKWYDVDVSYRGYIPEREFVGQMERNLTLSQALNLLSQNKITYKIEGRKLIIGPSTNE